MDIGEPCPECGDGTLVPRVNGETEEVFMGCSEFPECLYTTELEGWDRRDEGAE